MQYIITILEYINTILARLFPASREAKLVRAWFRRQHAIDALAVASKVLRECAEEFDVAHTEYDARYDEWAGDQTTKIPGVDK